MFDEMPDQFYQFLAAASRANNTTTTSPSPSSIPLSFSLFHNNGSYPTYPQTSFDYSQNGLLSPPPHLLQHSHHQTQLPFHQQVQQSSIASLKNDHHKEVSSLAPPLGLEPVDNPWSNDEVLSLLRIRSSLDNNWFPDFIWENVSRKLAEIGFKRSAEKCKEKFEEETRSFNSSNIISTCNNKNVINNYRLFGELEELYNNHADHHHHQQQQQQQQQQQPSVIRTQPVSEVDHHHDHQSPPPPPDPDDPVDDHHELEPSLLSYKDQTPDRKDEDDVEEEQVLEEEEDKTGQERLGNDDEDTTTRNDDKVGDDQHSVDNEDDSEKTQDNTKRETARKRKRHNKFEMFKGFCESIVNKMIAQQEQLHCKILQDMVKRDEEKIVKQEAWKKQEIERIRKEMEVRAHEQAVAGDRQAKILDFLKKFTSNPLESHSLREAIENLIKVPNASPNSSILTQEYSIVSVQQQPTTSCTTTHDQNPSSLVTHNCTNIPTSLQNENQTLQGTTKLAQPTLHESSQNPNPLRNNDKNDTSRLASSASANKSSESNHTSTNATDRTTDIKSPESHANPKPNLGYGKDDTGRRWPRDEVLALINIRCSLFNNNGDPHSDREGSSKGPLWERISQKMLELGYKRSAKRCKEKWENINKYFRKTKDLNKKRSIDSRTCPYFHQLSHIYSQGTVIGSPENKAMPLSGVQGDSSASSNGANTTKLHASQGNEGGVVQVSSAFDFEF